MCDFFFFQIDFEATSGLSGKEYHNESGHGMGWGDRVGSDVILAKYLPSISRYNFNGLRRRLQIKKRIGGRYSEMYVDRGVRILCGMFPSTVALVTLEPGLNTGSATYYHMLLNVSVPQFPLLKKQR